jgi:uncharacterized protein
MNVVVDTNVLVSGLLNPKGLPANILNLLLNGKLSLLYDNRIISEYENVLNRDEFGFKKENIEPFIDFLKCEGYFVTANPIKATFKDEDDKKFLEVAETGKAEYLITGNIVHFPEHKKIVTPKEFIEKNIDRL